MRHRRRRKRRRMGKGGARTWSKYKTSGITWWALARGLFLGRRHVNVGARHEIAEPVVKLNGMLRVLQIKRTFVRCVCILAV